MNKNHLFFSLTFSLRIKQLSPDNNSSFEQFSTTFIHRENRCIANVVYRYSQGE